MPQGIVHLDIISSCSAFHFWFWNCAWYIYSRLCKATGI